jgi:hypothetical protein
MLERTVVTSHDHRDPLRRGVSRRSFLHSSALTTVGATAVAIAGQAQAQNSDLAASGPGPIPTTLKVNGTDRTIQVEPRMTLAEALRGPLGLTGTKIACDRGALSARAV